MKKMTTILLLVLIPIILLSATYDLKVMCKALNLKNTQYLNRDWRLTEMLGESGYNGDWQNDTKSVYVYNSVLSTQVDTLKMYMYNTETLEWALIMNVGFVYDTSGQHITQLNYTFSYMGMTFPLFRMTVQYNAQYRTTMWMTETYDMDNLEWLVSFWSKIAYNANSINSIVSYNAATTDEPEFWTRTTFANDAQGRPVSTTDQDSADSLIWVESDRTSFTYHANDSSTGEDFIDALSQLFMLMEGAGTTNTWGSAMVAETIDQSFNPDLDTWENVSKDVYTYNAQNKLAETVSMIWADEWTNDLQTLVTYDTNGNLYQSLESSWTGTVWSSNYRYTYTWNGATANDDNTNPAIDTIRITTYPNPFNGEMSLRVNSKGTQPVMLSVYNTKGQLIKTISAKSNVNVSWDGRDEKNHTVSNGIYFVKAAIQGNSHTVKIIKMK